MGTPVKLTDLLEAFELAGNEWAYYLCKDTGEVTGIPDEVMGIVEEEEEGEQPPRPIKDWEQVIFTQARSILDSPDSWAELPSKHDIHEWRIMADFCDTIEDEGLHRELANAIHGRGAFRVFKDTLFRHGIEQQWYDYRTETFKRMAREWCDENGIAYTE